jgi:hypothetical protein
MQYAQYNNTELYRIDGIWANIVVRDKHFLGLQK